MVLVIPASQFVNHFHHFVSKISESLNKFSNEETHNLPFRYNFDPFSIVICNIRSHKDMSIFVCLWLLFNQLYCQNTLTYSLPVRGDLKNMSFFEANSRKFTTIYVKNCILNAWQAWNWIITLLWKGLMGSEIMIETSVSFRHSV